MIQKWLSLITLIFLSAQPSFSNQDMSIPNSASFKGYIEELSLTSGIFEHFFYGVDGEGCSEPEVHLQEINYNNLEFVFNITSPLTTPYCYGRQYTCAVLFTYDKKGALVMSSEIIEKTNCEYK